MDGLSESRLMSLAPMMDLSTLLSSSVMECRMLRSISSCLGGRWDNFTARESFLASLAAKRSVYSKNETVCQGGTCLGRSWLVSPSSSRSSRYGTTWC